MASKQTQIIILALLLSYQIAAGIWAFGSRWPPDLDFPVLLLVGFYVVSFVRATLSRPAPGLSFVWRALFSANLAFFLVGSVLCSLPRPGVCVRVPITHILGFMLSQYWPIFLIRNVIGGCCRRSVIPVTAYLDPVGEWESRPWIWET